MRKPTDNTLVAVFEEMARDERPIYKRINYVDGRELTIIVHPGGSNVVFTLAGRKGGKGDVMIVPLFELYNLVDTLRAQRYTVF